MESRTSLPWHHSSHKYWFPAKRVSEGRYHFKQSDRICAATTRTTCSRKAREIQSWSWERWLGWRGWQMIIYTRLVPPDDHLQDTGSSGWSFARGQSLQMIICKWPNPPDDHLQVAGSSGWSFVRGRFSRWPFARGQILRMIICEKPDPLDDHLQEAGSSGWSFARGWILQMII